jgi:hypothetical protein
MTMSGLLILIVISLFMNTSYVSTILEVHYPTANNQTVTVNSKSKVNIILSGNENKNNPLKFFILTLPLGH